MRRAPRATPTAAPRCCRPTAAASAAAVAQPAGSLTARPSNQVDSKTINASRASARLMTSPPGAPIMRPTHAQKKCPQ